MQRLKKSRHARRHSRRRRLAAETLESRRVLATFTVDATFDAFGGVCPANDPQNSDDCTIRSAIEAADANPGPDVIEIPPGNYLLSANLGSLSPTQAQDLTFVGTGGVPADVVIDGLSLVRVFHFNAFGADYDVSLRNLTIQNGVASNFGGGGIRATPQATLVLRDTVLQNNQADVDGLNNPSSGGAIETFGSVDIQNSEFRNNTATSNGGAIALRAPDIASASTIGNSTFLNNITGNASIDRGEGGAIYVQGNADLVLSQTFLQNNRAGNSGGGLHFEARTLAVNESTFDFNFAQGSQSDPINQDGAAGGGVYVKNSGSYSIIGGIFDNNNARDGGGGLESLNTPGTVDGTVFQFNSITGSNSEFDGGGGAIAVLNTVSTAAVSLANITVEGNEAPTAGGIATYNADVTITDSTISGNMAFMMDVGRAGGIGAFSDTAPTTLQIERSAIFGNTAQSQSGGIGSIDVSVSLTDSEVFQNTASNGHAGGISIRGSLHDPILSAERTSIYQNQSGGEGGGINVAGAGLSLLNVTLAENQAGNAGGGVSYDSNGTPAVASIRFFDHCGQLGGVC